MKDCMTSTIITSNGGVNQVESTHFIHNQMTESVYLEIFRTQINKQDKNHMLTQILFLDKRLEKQTFIK